jgi:hypothetical protein
MTSLLQSKEKLYAYCINLDREPEKFSTVKKEFSDFLDIERISAIDGASLHITGISALVQTNIRLFKRIIQESKQQFAIIIEDDIYRCPDFDTYFPKIYEFINNKENASTWDFISLDYCLNFEKPKMEIWNDFLYRVEKSRSAGFTIYNIDFLKKNIDYLSSCYCLDMTMKHNVNFIQLIPNKMIVKQIVDKISTTEHMNTNYYEEFYHETELYMKNYRF